MKSTAGKVVLISAIVMGACIPMAIPMAQAQSLFFGTMPEQVTVYHTTPTYAEIAPAAGDNTPDVVTTSTTRTTTVTTSTGNVLPGTEEPMLLYPPIMVSPVPNGARGPND
jgi:hypothetical protein